MADDFLGTFTGSAARAKVLRVFVFERGALTVALTAKRSGVSPRVAQEEIKELVNLGILKKAKFTITIGGKVIAGKQKEAAWSFDQSFKYASAITKFVHEVSPVHYKNIVTSLRRAGKIATVVLSGAFVGDDSRPADLIIAADNLNESRLEAAVRALEPQFGREIRYAAFTIPEFRYRMTIQDRLLRDTFDFPHLILLDKTRLL